MNINATLFVQAINFLIAYFLFRFILLKPAYREIVQEQNEQDSLEGIVAADHKLLEDTHAQRATQWQVCQKDCRRYLPKSIQQAQMFRGITPDVSVHVPPPKELRAMEKRIAKTIISRVEDAYGTK